MKRVLVLCTGNSCRSIMAEALINTLGAGRYEAVSAGSNPAGYVHPKSIETLKRHGLDVGNPRSKSWNEFTGQPFDLVITVCDAAASETCPAFLGQHEKLHWSMPDPDKATGTEDEINAAFDEVFGMLKERVERELLNVILSANSGEDLLKILAAIDISVPGRTEGRKTEHTERYSICRLLSTLAKTEYLSYPLSLTKRERPDFLLTCKGQTIGIEVTEATSTDYSSYQALVQKQNPGHFIEPSHFRHGETLDRERQQELLQADKLTSDGWVGDGVEKEWSLFMKGAIEKKHQKLQEQSFEKFSQNWLLIYDNTPTLALDREYLIPYIETLLQNHTTPYFDMIFIESCWSEEESSESERKIFAVSHTDWKCFSLEDVWKQ